MPDAGPRPPKVLISYSWDSPAHRERVRVLADRLRAEGVDCEIDQYVRSAEEGWPLWMERQIEEADYVLMVCTETYHRRVTRNAASCRFVLADASVSSPFAPRKDATFAERKATLGADDESSVGFSRLPVCRQL